VERGGISYPVAVKFEKRKKVMTVEKMEDLLGVLFFEKERRP